MGRDTGSRQYEGGHRVPLIVSCADLVNPKTCETTTHSNDLLPTIAAFSGAKTEELEVDGVNLLPLLTSGEPLKKRTLFWRAGNGWAVRSGSWKLVFEDGRRQLFDLERDIAEQNDLSSEKPKLAASLTRAWQNWNATMPHVTRRHDESTP